LWTIQKGGRSITAADLLRIDVIDRIIYEPVGGAHRNHAEMFTRVGSAVATELDSLAGMDAAALRLQRRTRLLSLGRLGPL